MRMLVSVRGILFPKSRDIHVAYSFSHFMDDFRLPAAQGKCGARAVFIFTLHVLQNYGKPGRGSFKSYGIKLEQKIIKYLTYNCPCNIIYKNREIKI